MNVPEIRNALVGATLKKIYIDPSDEFMKFKFAGKLLSDELIFNDWRVSCIEEQVIIVYPITPQGYKDYVEFYQRKFSSSRVEGLIALQSVMRNLATEDELVKFRNSLFSIKDDLFEGINNEKIKSELEKVGLELFDHGFNWYDENYHITFCKNPDDEIDPEIIFSVLKFRHWKVSKVCEDSITIYPTDSKGYMEYIEYYRLQFRTTRLIAFIALQRIVAENGTLSEENELDDFFHQLNESKYLVCKD